MPQSLGPCLQSREGPLSQGHDAGEEGVVGDVGPQQQRHDQQVAEDHCGDVATEDRENHSRTRQHHTELEGGGGER